MEGSSLNCNRDLNLCLCPNDGVRGNPTMELRVTSFFIWALQGTVTSQVRSAPGSILPRPIWVIGLGKGSKCNSSTESNQLSSRWTSHTTWASMAGLRQSWAALLNLIYLNMRYYSHKALQQQASGYFNSEPCNNLENIHFNTVQYEQPSPPFRRYFTCQSTSYTCYQQVQAL